MGYVDFEYYNRHYGDIDRTVFERLLRDASRMIDAATTGIDGVRKLREFFPQDTDDAEAVKNCVCDLIQTMDQVRQAESRVEQTATENGSHGGIITSVSAGNESISYATGIQTPAEHAALDVQARKELYKSVIKDGLSGVYDSNGVSLLYAGEYLPGRWPRCTQM